MNNSNYARSRAVGVLAAVVSACALTACSSSAEPAAPVTTVETVTVQATTTTAVPTPAAASAVPAAPVTSAAAPVMVEMPAVVCLNLQDAQDLIQAAGVFYSRSADATGAGRNQVLDANWSVVAQTPDPGTLVGEGEAVLSVVKIGEPGDCS